MGAGMIRSSVLGMLQQMEQHDPLIYREIEVRGRPGNWRVTVLRNLECHATLVADTLEVAMTDALRADLEAFGAPLGIADPHDLFGTPL